MAEDIILQDPHGNLVTVSAKEAPIAIQQGGYSEAPAQAIREADQEAKYGTPGQIVQSALEGATSAATFGLIPGFGSNEDIRGRAETNPTARGVGQIGGLAASSFIPGLGEAELAGKAGQIGKVATEINPLSAQSVLKGAGEKAAQALGLGGEGAGVVSNIGSEAVKGAVETALFQGGDEVSKMLTEDPNQSLETAITNIGLASVLGGGLGVGVGAVSPLWNAKIGGKAAQFIEDFKGRIKEHLANPDPVGMLKEELESYYTTTKDVADEVYGPRGLKSQEIDKILPKELDQKILGQAGDLGEQVRTVINGMKQKPEIYPPRLSSKLENDLLVYGNGLQDSTTAKGFFDNIQRLKQRVQDYAEYKTHITPTDDRYDFVQKMRSLAPEFKTALEDTQVWGKAAERQVSINKAFSEFLQPLKDFESKFTTKLGDEKVLDPTKINTYINQLGKPNAEIKQEALQNFLKAAEKYRSVIRDTHANLGVESPLTEASLHHAKMSLKELSGGAKVADALIKRGLSRLGGETIGGGIGALIGHSFGSGFLGALVGEHALGPFFTSILPSLTKPILENANSPSGLKAAIDYGLSVVRGENLLTKTTKNLFKAGQEVLPTKLFPTEKETAKLEKQLTKIQKNPEELLKEDHPAGHYLPQHGQAIGQMAAASAAYLNSLRPNLDKKSPLDKEMKPSSIQKANYENALSIAEQPLIVLARIKEGRLTSQDVMHLNRLYPALHQRLISKLQVEMIDHLSKGETIPYSSRLGLSLFMGIPLDSTMSPQGIMSAQSVFLNPMMKPSEVQQAEHKVALNSFKKLSSLERTPLQNRAATR